VLFSFSFAFGKIIIFREGAAGRRGSYGQMVIARICPPMPLIQFVINYNYELDSNIVQTADIDNLTSK
jgi:hypothetical protein